MSKIRLPNPAMIVALLALFVALGGTAVAAGVVPLARRALLADNAKKLNGLTTVLQRFNRRSRGSRERRFGLTKPIFAGRWPGKGSVVSDAVGALVVR